METERIKRNVKKYNRTFFKHFFIGFGIVALTTFIIGYFDWLSNWINIKYSDKEFEIIATIIGFLGILLGFMLTALGIIISGIQNRFHNETNDDKKIQLNEYWKFLIEISKTNIFLLLVYILFFIVCLTQIDTIKHYNAQLYLISWCVLSTILTCYLIFDRIFDYYENPFEK